MMNFLLYPAKLILISAFMYGYYRLFLRDQRFHQFNRYFLLAGTGLAVLLPLLPIQIPLPAPAAGSNGVSLTGTLRVISLSGWGEDEGAGNGLSGTPRWWTLLNLTGLVYLAGMLTSLWAIGKSVRYMWRLRRKYTCQYIGAVRFYETTEPGTPFSWFRSVFWNSRIPFATKEGQQIFRHEWYHVQERHSLDLLLLEIVCCLGWFNPFFHLIRKELKTLHEFQADEYAIAQNDRHHYAELLVVHAIQHKKAGITHPFSQHEIKRRIMMLLPNSPQHPKAGLLRRMLAMPLLLVLFSAFAIRWTPVPSAPSPLSAGQPLTVVIDAGHGGSDEGAYGPNGIKEKDLTLQLAEKVRDLSSAYNLRIVLTRDQDILPGNAADIRGGLEKRVAIAEACKADLFLSLHVNFYQKRHEHDPVPYSGFETYISKRRTDKQGVLLATALLRQLSQIYITDTTIRQRDQGIYVLDKITCPAVILECGFINRPDDFRFISDKTNQEKVARSILEGIVRYGQALPESK